VAAASDPLVSVIVAARTRQAEIEGLIRCLGAQTLPSAAWELILVDDGSPAALTADNGARILRSDAPRGAYAARNQGIREAAGKLIAVTDADCRPRPDWLAEMVSALDRADMAAGAIHVTVSDSPGIAERIDAVWNLDQESYVSRGFAAFANFACTRSVIDRVGPFNDRLVSNGDREFCLRAGAAGFSLAYVPGAVVEHEALRGVRALAGRSFRLGRGRAQTAAVGSGPARSHDRNWLPLRSYLPASSLHLAAYPLVGLPLAAGYAAGLATARLGRG
jgi:glycosyltransferase involved in cell wall biosynthesis